MPPPPGLSPQVQEACRQFRGWDTEWRCSTFVEQLIPKGAVHFDDGRKDDYRDSQARDGRGCPGVGGGVMPLCGEVPKLQIPDSVMSQSSLIALVASMLTPLFSFFLFLNSRIYTGNTGSVMY